MTHDIAEKPNGKRECSGQLPHDMKRKKDKSGLKIFFYIMEKTTARNPVIGNSNKYT